MRSSVAIVLISIAALFLEAGLFFHGVTRSGPDVNLIALADRAGIVTTGVCIVSGAVGLFQKPAGIARGFLRVGIAIGIFGLVAWVYIETQVRSCAFCTWPA